MVSLFLCLEHPPCHTAYGAGVTIEYTDYPIDALAITMQEAIYKGGKAYLKFTCVYCHSRQTIDEANKLYTQGKCEECGTVTDIAKRGGNLLVILPVR